MFHLRAFYTTSLWWKKEKFVFRALVLKTPIIKERPPIMTKVQSIPGAFGFALRRGSYAHRRSIHLRTILRHYKRRFCGIFDIID
jgi:hypothetical protein